MKKVRSAKTSEHVAAELLRYFRARTVAKRAVDRMLKGNLKGKAATEKELRVAEDALRQVFIGQPAYPPHFCGDNIDWSSSPVEIIEELTVTEKEKVKYVLQTIEPKSAET